MRPSRERRAHRLEWALEWALVGLLVLGVCVLWSTTPRHAIPMPSADVDRDVTTAVERLGNPFLERYPGDANLYPRNVWDMQWFDGRVYLGAGNSGASGPNPNAGPVDIWAYDTQSNRFVNEYTVLEEQIDQYRVIDGRLTLPGRDPRESWDFGNFYRLEQTGWRQYRTLRNTIHTYDMLKFNGRLYASISTSDNGGGIAVSTDDGQTWSRVQVGAGGAFGVFVLADHLYAVKSIPTDPTLDSLPLQDRTGLLAVHELQTDGQFKPRSDLTFGVLFPAIAQGQPWERWGQMVRYANFGDKLVYIGGETLHQVIPFGLFVLLPSSTVQRIMLPSGALPWDILIRDDTCYVLLGTKQAAGHYLVSVIASSDLMTWRELFHFDSATFARSFELHQGDFYFGLGTGVGPSYDPRTWEMSPAAGDILRVSRSAYTEASQPYKLYLPMLET